MEEKINIAAILKDKKNGIRLYSPIFGDCTYCYIHDETSDICVKKQCKVMIYFNFEGLYDTAGECLLFPSKKMRDWEKFSWKKGDTLSCGVDNLCIFEKWANKEYTEFYAKFVTPNYSGNTFKTEKWSKETNEEVIKQYISNIEEFKGGKLNLTTLEIEKTQPEFKDGDVVFVRCKRFCYIEIFNYFKDDELYDYASLSTTLQMIDICGKYPISKDEIVEIRIATDSEKKQLFEALAKENKVWNAEKKQVVDLKIKWMDLKPFDKVITRGDNNDIWTANIFSHMNSYGEYVAIGCVGGYHYCLPYNDDTAHLIGTTDEWKGGEG